MSRDLTDALSKLFIKLGGKLSDSKENKGPVDYIDDITDIVEPGSGGNNPSYFIVTFSYDEDVDKWEADKTFNEIKNAYEKGKLILFALADSCDVHIALYRDDGDFQRFECIIQEVVPNDSMVEMHYWFIEYSDNNIEVISTDAQISLNS